jgi:hypothetical protein
MVGRTGGSRHGYAGLSDRGDLDGQEVNSSSLSSPGTPPLVIAQSCEQQSSPRYRSKWLHGV